MFKLDVASPDYKDPWAKPFQERRSELLKGKFKVAYYYDYPDSSTFRYRAYNMIQALGDQTDVSASFFAKVEGPEFCDLLPSVDRLVVCRALNSGAVNRILSVAKARGIKVFYDVDDLVFDPAYTHLVVHVLGQDVDNLQVLDYWFSYFGRQSATLASCDEVITTNAFLAEKAATYSQKPVHVLPNSLNREQIEYSEKIFQQKAENRFARDGHIHLGYFSGTPSHSRDFDVAADALITLLEADPRIHLKLVGFVNPDSRFDRFSHRILKTPLVDFVDLQRHMAQVEVNLVPLEESVFTNCKSELKFFEAAVVGTLTIASPVYTYRLAIEDGMDGYLCRSYEWAERIRGAIADLGRYPEMAGAARSKCLDQYGWYNQAEPILKVLLS